MSIGVAGSTDGASETFQNYIPADGGFVAFDSAANNVVPGDTNARQDVFVRGPLI